MPPRIGTRAQVSDFRFTPTQQRPESHSALPDDAFAVEGYTRELDLDRREPLDYGMEMYGPSKKQQDQWAQQRRAREAGPIHRPRTR